MPAYVPILAAEDEHTDAVLLEMALRHAGVPNPLVLTHDGEAAVDYLRGAGLYGDRAAHPLPGLLLLDLKMPRMSGFDVLEWLSSRPELKYLPVVVLSSSSDARDLQKAKEMGAREYLVKPHDFHGLIQMVQGVAARWLARPDEIPATRESAVGRAWEIQQ
jgi:CheY-like chemotaxis protein